MKILKYLIIIASVTLTACSAPGIPWDDFKAQKDMAFCKVKYKEIKQQELCMLDFTAYSRAKTECKKSPKYDYCLFSTESGWGYVKDLMENPTIQHAKTYPVICKHDERNNPILCSNIK